MIRKSLLAAMAVALAVHGPAGADPVKKALRRLEPPPPITLAPLPTGSSVQPVRFARAVVHPRDGEPWALVYTMGVLCSAENPPPPDELLTWDGGASQRNSEGFARVFAEELRKYGYVAGGDQASLLDEGPAADIQIGVTITDLKGRFCGDCPALFRREKTTGAVAMTARWEIYSSLQRTVLATVTTTGGHVATERINAVLPVVFDAFRENVRLLMASEAFQRVVTSDPPTVAATSPPASLAAISFAAAPPAPRPIGQASDSVVAVFASDGMGTAFLVSRDGYLLTNQHVVGNSKFVKLRWSDGLETVGEVVRTHKARDVALIKADPRDRAPLSLRRATPFQGATVFAIGTPLDPRLQSTLTKGIVSANRMMDGFNFIQSDVVINGGNSGGPLLDESGAVVGVCVSGIDLNGAPAGLNFFIPIGDALDFLALRPQS